MSLRLVPLSPFDGKSHWELLQTLEKSEGFCDDGIGIQLAQFPAYLERHVRISTYKNYKNDFVPETTYWLCDDEKVAGVLKLRTHLSDDLMQTGGNIDYAVGPEYRKRGYAKHMLRLAIEKARSKGLDFVILTCSKSNEASIRVIQAAGGMLQKTVENQHFYYIFT